MAAVTAAGVANLQNLNVGGLGRSSSLKKLTSAPDGVAVGVLSGQLKYAVRAQTIENRPPVRPAVSFPLFPRSMEAYTNISGHSTTPVSSEKNEKRSAAAVRPAVSFPLFPRSMEAYKNISGQATSWVAPLWTRGAEALEIQKEQTMPIPVME